MSAESIWSKPLTKCQTAALSNIAKRQKLREFCRPAKKLVAVRLDAHVFAWLQQFGAGSSTRINHVLRTVMTQSR